MTIIEVMISMIILGVVLVGLGQGLAYGIRANNENKMRVANLNTCKSMMESIKARLSETQAVFDNTATGDATFFVDANGEKTYSAIGNSQREAFTADSAFRVRTVISNVALTQTVAGETKVLVKALEVRVVNVQNMAKNGHEVTMKVEIIRPSA